MSPVRRPYHSTLRADQARATRRAVVSAARDLFVELGWSGTTIDAVAAHAGVSRKTVFTSVGGKAALLKLALDWALVGDDEPVPLSARQVIAELVAAIRAPWGGVGTAGSLCCQVRHPGRGPGIGQPLCPKLLVVDVDGDSSGAHREP